MGLEDAIESARKGDFKAVFSDMKSAAQELIGEDKKKGINEFYKAFRFALAGKKYNEQTESWLKLYYETLGGFKEILYTK